MTKTIYIVIILLGISLNSIAQQDPMYSEYVFDGLIINPAYAGTRDFLNTALLFRDQWLNIPGAPKTGMLSIDAPLRNQRVGIGLNVESDVIGVTSFTNVTGDYSYKLKFPNSSLNLGIQLGVGFTNSNLTSVLYNNGGGPSDPAFQSNYHVALPIFGFGIYYYSDKFFAGVSIPEIAGYSIQKALYGNSDNINLDLSNHFFFYTGYLINLSPDVKFKPSVLLKYVNGSPIEMDLNGVFWFYDFIALGFSYRSLASIDFLAQVRITDQLYLGYAYEYPTTALSTFSSGSHEIMLQYLFDFSHARIITPRFF